MKVLLVGEFNRSHKFLKEGLEKLNHQAIVIGLTDGFKDVDVDIQIKERFTKGLSKMIKNVLFRLFKFDFHSFYVKKQILKNEHRLKGFDIVQFINESSFNCQPKTERQIFDLLCKWNVKAYLLSCGTDYISVKYAFDQKFRYSILTSFFEGRISENDHSLGLKYISPNFFELHKHIYNNIKGVISCDLDYSIPLQDHPKHLGLIPHPINTDTIAFSPIKITDKIIIFHGINRLNYFKKGNDIFEKALEIIATKHPNDVIITTVENVPYKVYQNAFDKAHILLDQVYAYDQGYNALEAMAKGKVVFTGAEQEWLDHYKLKENAVAINALPEVEDIVKKLEWLILNPDKIFEISENARDFVKREHDYIFCAKKFIDVWSKA